jgi:hypothetical protein
MRRRRAINSYSEEQLGGLLRPIATDFYIALKYINAQITGKVIKHRCQPITATAASSSRGKTQQTKPWRPQTSPKLGKH